MFIYNHNSYNNLYKYTSVNHWRNITNIQQVEHTQQIETQLITTSYVYINTSVPSE